MRLKLKAPICIRPDKNGEYPEAIGKRLIAAGIAVLETATLSQNEIRKKNK